MTNLPLSQYFCIFVFFCIWLKQLSNLLYFANKIFYICWFYVYYQALFLKDWIYKLSHGTGLRYVLHSLLPSLSPPSSLPLPPLPIPFLPLSLFLPLSPFSLPPSLSPFLSSSLPLSPSLSIPLPLSPFSLFLSLYLPLPPSLYLPLPPSLHLSPSFSN